MPLVAHNNLPAFEKLSGEGLKVLKPDTASHQDIRELHIGLLNMMPDAALSATERQFFRLIAESNPIAQFFVHPFTIDALPRSDAAKKHIDKYYETFDQVRELGLDALIISGANVVGSELSGEPFWDALIEVADWAHDNVTSTLCSCLATHAILEFRFQQKRATQDSKKWGVFEHRVVDQRHPLVADINTRFDVPHSRWNTVFPEQFEAAGLKILVTGDDGCVHLATSSDGIRSVFFQGHPEYDTVSLLKEYKREIHNYTIGESAVYPPLPVNYFGKFEAGVMSEYQSRIYAAMEKKTDLPEFPEALILSHLNNTWHDTACAVVGRWMGLVYHITHQDVDKPFMDDIDIDNPLNL
ncbi:MAG: homoserine O-succinyltransferase [Gammaproteobacteria bacterium]|nr:homoserine O-succinyltransferase [Gammaproteobacteria bacterium]